MNDEVAKAIAHELISRGVKPDVAAGAVAGIMGESGGNLDPTAYNAKENSGGFAQWHLDRLTGDHGLLAFAQANGVPGINVNNGPDSKKVPLSVQIKYLGHELDGRYSGVLKGLQSLNTGQEGLELWVNNYESPLDKRGAIAQRAQYVRPLTMLLGGKDPGPVAVSDTATAGAGTTGAASGTTSALAPPTPEATLGSMLGQAFTDLGGGGSGGGSGGSGLQFSDPPDQPAIRSPALEADFMPSHSPVPASLAAGAGSSPVGQQLGQLAAVMPGDPALVNPAYAPSITAGAPSMSAMLAGVGTQGRPGGPPNLMNPYMATARFS
jgi:hypothetical protein